MHNSGIVANVLKHSRPVSSITWHITCTLYILVHNTAYWHTLTQTADIGICTDIHTDTDMLHSTKINMQDKKITENDMVH